MPIAFGCVGLQEIQDFSDHLRVARVVWVA